MKPKVTLAVNKIIIKNLKGYKIAYHETEDSIEMQFVEDNKEKNNDKRTTTSRFKKIS